MAPVTEVGGPEERFTAPFGPCTLGGVFLVTLIWLRSAAGGSPLVWVGAAGCEAPGAEGRVQGRHGLMAPASACCQCHSVGLQRRGRMERRKGAAVVSLSIHKARTKAASDHQPQKEPGQGPCAVSFQEIRSRPWTHMSWYLNNGHLFWFGVCGYKRVNESRLVFKQNPLLILQSLILKFTVSSLPNISYDLLCR